MSKFNTSSNNKLKSTIHMKIQKRIIWTVDFKMSRVTFYAVTGPEAIFKIFTE